MRHYNSSHAIKNVKRNIARFYTSNFTREQKFIFILNKSINAVSPTGAVAEGQCEAPRVTEPRNGGNRLFFLVWKKEAPAEDAEAKHN